MSLYLGFPIGVPLGGIKLNCSRIAPPLVMTLLPRKRAKLIFFLFNETRHAYFYMLRIASQTDWTDWAEFLCGHSGVAGGVLQAKNSKKKFTHFLKIFFFQHFFCHGQRRALQLVLA